MKTLRQEIEGVLKGNEVRLLGVIKALYPRIFDATLKKVGLSVHTDIFWGWVAHHEKECKTLSSIALVGALIQDLGPTHASQLEVLLGIHFAYDEHSIKPDPQDPKGKKILQGPHIRCVVDESIPKHQEALFRCKVLLSAFNIDFCDELQKSISTEKDRAKQFATVLTIEPKEFEKIELLFDELNYKAFGDSTAVKKPNLKTPLEFAKAFDLFFFPSTWISEVEEEFNNAFQGDSTSAEDSEEWDPEESDQEESDQEVGYQLEILMANIRYNLDVFCKALVQKVGSEFNREQALKHDDFTDTELETIFKVFGVSVNILKGTWQDTFELTEGLDTMKKAGLFQLIFNHDYFFNRKEVRNSKIYCPNHKNEAIVGFVREALMNFSRIFLKKYAPQYVEPDPVEPASESRGTFQEKALCQQLYYLTLCTRRSGSKERTGRDREFSEEDDSPKTSCDKRGCSL